MIRAALVLCASITFAQTIEVLGPPRWFPVAPMADGRGPVAAAYEKQFRALVERIRALPALNPPPGVYPKADLSFLSDATPAALLMLGFWPPHDVRLRSGQLTVAGELSHLLFYANRVRESAFDRTYWRDAEGIFYPQPVQLGDVQGFPVYQGFGDATLSGILVVQPAGRALFTPVSQDRFHRFAVAAVEKEIASAQPAVEQARRKYEQAASPAGAAEREARIAKSLETYRQNRPRTPEQMAYRQTELRRLETEELERQRVDAAPETNRLTGPLRERLRKAQAALAALTPGQRTQPACHVTGGRDSGVPQPALPGTPGCTPVVKLGAWYDAAQPQAFQLISVERYWMAKEDIRRGADRSPRNLAKHMNAETIDALDWRAIAAGLR